MVKGYFAWFLKLCEDMLSDIIAQGGLLKSATSLGVNRALLKYWLSLRPPFGTSSPRTHLESFCAKWDKTKQLDPMSFFDRALTKDMLRMKSKIVASPCPEGPCMRFYKSMF